jgi:hypothetical protein
MDLNSFCCKDETHRHYNIDAPYSQGEWTYATDGKILIRVPRLPEITNEKGPKSEPLFNEAMLRPVTVWQSLPPFELGVENCEWCSGTGYMVECPKVLNAPKCANGESKECQIYNDDCLKSCLPTNKCAIPCEDCNGTGKVKDPGNIIMAGSVDEEVRVSAIYLDMIKDLPNVMIAPYDWHSAIRFKFDGGEGLIMPMKR